MEYILLIIFCLAAAVILYGWIRDINRWRKARSNKVKESEKLRKELERLNAK